MSSSLPLGLTMAFGGLKDHFSAGGYYSTTNSNYSNYLAMLVEATLSYWYCVPLFAVTRELPLPLPLESLFMMGQFLSRNTADIQNSSPSNDLSQKASGDEGEELSQQGQSSPPTKPKTDKKKKATPPISSVAPPKSASPKSGHILRTRTPRVVPTPAASSKYHTF